MARTKSINYLIDASSPWAAGLDSANETALVFMLLHLFLTSCQYNTEQLLWLSFIFLISWSFWKAGRAAWVSWARLESLHQKLYKEKYNIEHYRDQGKSELEDIYKTKGFKGKLLEEAIQTLVTDENRFLKVMIEEKLGLTLEKYEHPLRIAFGAWIGSFSIGIILLSATIFSANILNIIGVLLIAIASGIASYWEGNKIINAVIWNIAIAILVYGFAYLSYKFLIDLGYLA